MTPCYGRKAGVFAEESLLDLVKTVSGKVKGATADSSYILYSGLMPDMSKAGADAMVVAFGAAGVRNVAGSAGTTESSLRHLLRDR